MKYYKTRNKPTPYMPTALTALRTKALSYAVPACTFEDVTGSLMDPDDVVICRKAHGVVKVYPEPDRWGIAVGAECNLFWNLETLRMAPPLPDRLHLNRTCWRAAFRTAVETYENVAEQWGNVDRCVQWFNANEVSPAAVMEFWPTMYALCPNNEKLAEYTPGQRFKDPPGISVILPRLRATRELVAAAALLPALPERTKYVAALSAFGNASYDPHPAVIVALP